MSFPIKIQKVQVQQNDGTISNPIPLSTGVNIRQGEVETAVDIAHDEPIGAYSEYSVASGHGTKATAPNQAVVGQYNAENNDALFIVGDGTSESARSNAFEVLKNNTAKAKNLIVENNLTVRGTTTSIESEVLTVADNMIVTNSLGEDIDSLSGLAIRKNQTDVYGIAYDSADDTVKLGLGTIGADNNFAFNSGDGQAIATREGLENGDLVEWNTEKNTLVPTQERAKIGSAIVDNEAAYQKEIPANAASYAEIKKIGCITRKCKNLWSFGDQSFTGSILVELEQPLPAGEYTMAVECVSNDTDSEVSLITFIDALGAGTNDHITITRGERAVGHIVLTNTVTHIRLNAGPNYSASTGDTATYSKIMLNEGATALPYEPYYEGLRDIKVTEIKSTSANLAKPRNDLEAWGCSITFIDDTGKYTLTSTNSYTAIYARIARVTLFAGVTYTLSLTNVAGSLTNMVVWAADTTRSLLDTPNRSATITPLVTAEYDIAVYMASGYSISVGSTASFYLMLNKGAAALTYEPYEEFVTPIPEAVQALEGYGLGINESVYNYIDYEKKQFVKRVEKVDLGTLEWIKSNGTPGGFYVTRPNIPLYNSSLSVSMVCDKYNFAGVRSESPFYGSDKQLTCYASNRLQEFYVCDTVYTDTDAATFKAAMSGVMLVYELAEPIVTDISDFITSDNLLPVEANGTITMVNEYDYDAPSEIAFYKGQSGAVGADTFVGDLTGVASRSIADENGNNIATTYANKVVEETQYDISYERSVPANLPTPWSKVTKIGGMSYKTKNLIPFQSGQTVTQSGVTLTVNTDGSITINGTATNDLWFTFNAIYLNIGKQYTFYAKNCPNFILACYLYNDSDIWMVRDSPIIKTASQERYVFVVGGGAGSTFNNLTIYPMLNEGATALPYEQYFSGIRDTKVTEIRSVEANLINPEWAQPNGSYGGVTFTKNTDGSITINGTAVSDVFYDLIAPAVGGSYILQPNTSYYASLGDNFVVDETKLFAVGYIVNGATTYPIWGAGRVFTTPAEFYNLVVRVRAYAGAVFNNVTIYPMIVKSNVAVPYEPYKADIKAIPAEVQALDGYGLGLNENLYNYLEWQPEDNIKTWHKNVHKIVLTGTESWQRSGTNGGGARFQYTPAVEPKYTTMNDNTVCLSNQYNSVSTTNTWNNIDGVTTNENTIEIKDSRYADVDAFKAYLAEQYAAGAPVEVVYTLATPEVTDISELLPDDNFIRVEEGGTIYAENSYRYKVPLETAYYVDINKARNKGLVVDDMKQSVTRAVQAETALSFSGTSLTIGNTTVTEAQLQKLLALLNEIELV